MFAVGWAINPTTRVLEITGDDNANDVRLELVNSVVNVRVNGAWQGSVNYYAFNGVRANLNGGNDRFEAPQLSDRMTVTGGSGNDTIITGVGDDQVFGGDGNDVIEGRNGSDTLF